jgi:hypothetical protein
MARFLLLHRHEAAECRFAFAAWRGFDSPLRRRAAAGSCHVGGHSVFWEVEAPDAASALSQLPAYVAERTEAHELREMDIP